jgi:hypothetical protein
MNDQYQIYLRMIQKRLNRITIDVVHKGLVEVY